MATQRLTMINMVVVRVAPQHAPTMAEELPQTTMTNTEAASVRQQHAQITVAVLPRHITTLMAIVSGQVTTGNTLQMDIIWKNFLISTRLVIGFCLEDWERLSIFVPSINKMFAYEKDDDDSCTDVHSGIE